MEAQEISLDVQHYQYKNEGACNVILSYTGPFDPSLKVEVQNIQLEEGHWVYKGEGINNIILSFSGPLALPLTGHVLRLKKTNSSKAATHAHHDREVIEYLFVRDTMKPRIGNDYVHPGVIVKVESNFLKSINDRIHPLRPPHRLVADLDTAATSAFVLPDLSVFPRTLEQKKHIFCVEIKPKWGFVSSSPFIHANHKVKTEACRYCLHQHLKLLQGSIKHVSAYCPQDLYSGEPERVRKALRALFSHPQNNLKVYCDGELCFTGSLGGRRKTDTDFDIDHLAGKLKNALPHSKDTIASLSEILLQILQNEPVLKNLRNIQVQDDIDIQNYLICFHSFH